MHIVKVQKMHLKSLFIIYTVIKPSKPLIRVKLLKFFGK
uniref:Uncharacterized protein n=1 Tax=Siphoviridae sp. cttOT32 TaxID=2826493 RepID=A0A8S5QNU0_9CAUD|nr:MAG TPA: hypothetical protein [Siphoviridae sp. cttOT32]